PRARPEKGGPSRIRGEVNTIYLDDESQRAAAFCALNSTTYYFWHCAWTDGRHINPSDVSEFPLGLDRMDPSLVGQFEVLAQRLNHAYDQNRSLWRKSGLLIDSV